MKENFDDFIKQGHYISRFVSKYTDLDRTCQYCGKPAEVKNNINNPYLIQFICKQCKVEKKMISIYCDMADDIPLINLKEHIINDTVNRKNIDLDDELISKLKYLLTSDLTKEQALNYLDMKPTQFKKVIAKYEELYDKNYSKKLDTVLKENRNQVVTKARLNYTVNVYTNNNLSVLKYKMGLTNKDIINKSGGRIKANAISLICNGKSEPKVQTKCILAEALGVTVKDIFYEDTICDNIHNYNEYLKLNETFRKKALKFFKLEPTAIDTIAKHCNVSISKVQDFILGNAVLAPKELELLNQIV